MTEAYLGEIREQPGILSALARGFEGTYGAELAKARQLMASGAIDKIVLTGMGGSLFSLYPAHLRLSARGQAATLWDCSELVQQAPEAIDERTLAIAVSQSGESAELVRMCQSSRRARLKITVTNSGRSTLADWADVAVRTEAGPERTASTKTYTAGLAALALLTTALLGEDIGAAAAAIEAAAGALDRQLPAWRKAADGIVDFAGHAAPIVYVGRGANLATATMAALLTAEASKLPCLGMSGGQFRHGPLELVRAGFSCVMFESPHPETAALDRRLADTIIERGGRCVWITSVASGRGTGEGELVVGIPACGEDCLTILNIVPVQLLQVPLAIARGFVPAQFLNASKVTTSE